MAIKLVYYPVDFSFSMNKSVTEKHLKKIKKDYPERKWIIKRVDVYKDGINKLPKKGYKVFEEIVD